MTQYYYVRLPRPAHPGSKLSAPDPEVSAMVIPVAHYAVPEEVLAAPSSGVGQIPGVRFVWIEGVPSHCWVRAEVAMTAAELTAALEEFRACF